MIKRTELAKTNLNPNFIGSWMIEPLAICDKIITYFEENKYKQNTGRTTDGCNCEIKERVDLSINPNEINKAGNEIFKSYFENIYECYKDYTELWPYLKGIGAQLEIGTFFLAKYTPGQHFQALHCERTELSNLHRSLAFMTYLNDVEGGGSTYWDNYDLELQPMKGLTVIWPADWTHTHKGNIVKSGEKYIVTGYINFTK